MERSFADSDLQYRLLFEQNPQPMWVYDPETLRFLAVNDSAIERYGYAREEFLAMTIEDIRPAEQVLRLRRALASEAAADQEGDIWVRVKRDGEPIDVEVLAGTIELDGRPARLVLATDITARLKSERMLRHQADHDALTDVFNRGRLESELDALLASPQAAPCAVIIVGLDNFKFVNDSFGHAYGDDVLKRVADTLREQLDQGQRIGRLGGDEFGLLLPSTSPTRARDAAARIVRRLREHVFARDRSISASAGVAVAAAGSRVSAEELLIAADIALHEAKDAGRDRYAFAADIRRGHTWIDQIRAAVADERLELHAQPIIDVDSGNQIREELLVRMLSPEGEVIPPASFIPAAERYGLIHEIDRWVVSRGLELAASGRAVEINLSAHSLGDHEITRMVAAAVERGVDASNLVFEITETAAAANYRQAADFAKRLAAIGCAFALDDFGTGFGSLSYLKHVPFAYLKIDMEFVRELASDPFNERIVSAVVNIAAQFGQETIAEGVESKETMDLLRALGVDHAQGYHIARPAPVAAAPQRRRFDERAAATHAL